MPSNAVNKVIVGGEAVIDLTGDTVTADKVLSGETFHLKSGETSTGTCTFDSDTSEDTAAASEILYGKTAHAVGNLLTGTMPNNEGVTGTISAKTEQYAVPGYHDGSGKVSIAAVEQAKLVSTNIRQGITLLGVQGSMTGTEDVNAQSRNITPSMSSQTVLPETGYNYLSQVVVAAIPVTRTDNASGGVTVTIG